MKFRIPIVLCVIVALVADLARVGGAVQCVGDSVVQRRAGLLGATADLAAKAFG